MLNRVLKFAGLSPRQAVAVATSEGHHPRTTEAGVRTSPENELERIYNRLQVDYSYRATVMDVRVMDVEDGRVKKIHKRMATAAVKSPLVLGGDPPADVQRRWRDFVKRLQLDKKQKRISDARGLLIEGELVMQWVLNPGNQVVGGVRMPADTIKPRVAPSGHFEDVRHAYDQLDVYASTPRAQFALWQITRGRLDPDNFDDHGSRGRPFLDAVRKTYAQMRMTDDDLALRRHDRAWLRFSHVLEGATPDELAEYARKQEQLNGTYTRDFFMNKKGGVTAVQGDSNLDQIADIEYLVDTFFVLAGAKGIFGYADKLNRDVLEDLKKEYYEEVDAVQDVLAEVYQTGFFLDLWLAGIYPQADWQVSFIERQTESRNQRADLALKLMVIGASEATALEVAGLDPEREKKRKSKEKPTDPYGGQPPGGGRPPVKITPGNARKGESATDISTRTVAR